MTLSREEIQARIKAVAHWYHRIEVAPGVITPGVNDSPGVLRLLDLPTDCSGLRVLDIGARDGYFSFECERRGAEVVAIDHCPPDATGFLVAKELVGSKIELIQENLYNLTPEKYGRFDIVLFLGVLYHLRDPLMALDIIRRLTTKRLFLESFVIDEALHLGSGGFAPLKDIAPALVRVPIMQFFPRDTLQKDHTNYWGPNMACIEQMLEESNFSVVRSVPNGQRAIFDCVVKNDPVLEHFTRIARSTC